MAKTKTEKVQDRIDQWFGDVSRDMAADLSTERGNFLRQRCNDLKDAVAVVMAEPDEADEPTE